MKRFPTLMLAAAAVLAAGAAGAQSTRGVGHTGGITFSPPAPAPPAPPAAPVVTPITPAPPTGARDLFRAGPDTYAPRYDRLVPSPLFYPYGVIGYALPDDERHRGRREYRDEPAAPAPAPAAAPTPAAPPAPAVPAAPVVRVPPRPHYLIPRCYAGDAPPRPAQLPAGCSMADLRRIDPPK